MKRCPFVLLIALGFGACSALPTEERIRGPVGKGEIVGGMATDDFVEVGRIYRLDQAPSARGNTAVLIAPNVVLTAMTNCFVPEDAGPNASYIAPLVDPNACAVISLAGQTYYRRGEPLLYNDRDYLRYYRSSDGTVRHTSKGNFALVILDRAVPSPSVDAVHGANPRSLAPSILDKGAAVTIVGLDCTADGQGCIPPLRRSHGAAILEWIKELPGQDSWAHGWTAAWDATPEPYFSDTAAVQRVIERGRNATAGAGDEGGLAISADDDPNTAPLVGIITQGWPDQNGLTQILFIANYRDWIVQKLGQIASGAINPQDVVSPLGASANVTQQECDPNAGKTLPCNDCGQRVCLPDGSWDSFCKGTNSGCGANQTCSASGVCEGDQYNFDNERCTVGATQACGECGVRHCFTGFWQVVCNPADSLCDPGQTCEADNSNQRMPTSRCIGTSTVAPTETDTDSYTYIDQSPATSNDVCNDRRFVICDSTGRPARCADLRDGEVGEACGWRWSGPSCMLPPSNGSAHASSTDRFCRLGLHCSAAHNLTCQGEATNAPIATPTGCNEQRYTICSKSGASRCADQRLGGVGEACGWRWNGACALPPHEPGKSQKLSADRFCDDGLSCDSATLTCK